MQLSEDVIYLQDKGEVMVLGDLNTRTGNLADIINPDKSDEQFGITIIPPPQKRNSRDPEIDKRGLDLIE